MERNGNGDATLAAWGRDQMSEGWREGEIVKTVVKPRESGQPKGIRQCSERVGEWTRKPVPYSGGGGGLRKWARVKKEGRNAVEFLPPRA